MHRSHAPRGNAVCAAPAAWDAERPPEALPRGAWERCINHPSLSIIPERIRCNALRLLHPTVPRVARSLILISAKCRKSLARPAEDASLFRPAR